MTRQPALQTMLLAGDMALDGADHKVMLRHVAPLFRKADVAFANCEWALTDRRSAAMAKSGLLLGSWPRHIAAFVACGIDVVSLANNHVMNFGWPGLEQTIELLDEAGIVHCGAGRNLAEAHAPAFVDTAGGRIAFLAYTSVFSPEAEARDDQPGMAVIRVEARYKPPARAEEMPGAPYQVETIADPGHVALMRDDIARAREQADIVVVSFHWGVSGGHQSLVGYQRELGHQAVDSGADLIVGHHPHVIQGAELYKGKLIAYSLAQCGFDMVHSSLGEEGLLVETGFASGRIQAHRLIPIGDANQEPHPLGGRAADSCLYWLDRLSRPLGTEMRFDGPTAAPHPLRG